MLQRLYSHVAKAIQPCCGGYTAMLRRLYSHVVEAIRFFLPIIIPPQQNCFELFWVVGWVVAIYLCQTPSHFYQHMMKANNVLNIDTYPVINYHDICCGDGWED